DLPLSKCRRHLPHNLGMAVPVNERTLAERVIDVLLPGDIPDAAPLSVAEDHRIGRAEVAAHPARQALPRAFLPKRHRITLAHTAQNSTNRPTQAKNVSDKSSQ